MATCGEVLIELLQDYGIDTVFGIPGVHTLELYRGLHTARMRHITPRHEQGAGFMADGYTRATGRLAVCFIITGPGMTNIATAMAQALADSIPMLVISSVNHSYQLGMGEGRLHELPGQSSLVGRVARFSHTLLRADELGKVLARAFAVFHGARPGPVHIEIPIDVLTANADHLDRKAAAIPYPPGPSPQAIAAGIGWLKTATRPLLAVGGGAINAASEVVALAEKLAAPVINTVNAKGVMPYSHPLAVGGSASCTAVRAELQTADLVLAVGTELGETDYDFFSQGELRLEGRLIRIDIDAAQLSRNVRADLALCSDAAYALRAFHLALADWHNQAAAGHQRARQLRAQLQAARDPGYRRLFEAIRAALPTVIVVGDSTQPTYYAWRHYETEQPRRYFHSASGFGTLGYAIPAAIGAKLAASESPVVGLIGDGGAQFTVGELACAVAARLPVIFLVWNNAGYGEIKHSMVDAGIQPVGVDIQPPDIVALARAFGCCAQRATTPEALQVALVRANERQLPTVIEVMQSDFIDG